MSKAEPAELFFALGDPTRLSLVSRLGREPLSATALSEGARVTRQAIVKHLKLLEGAGLVTSRKHGREVLYLLEPKRLSEAKRFLDVVSASWDDALLKLKELVES